MDEPKLNERVNDLVAANRGTTVEMWRSFFRYVGAAQPSLDVERMTHVASRVRDERRYVVGFVPWRDEDSTISVVAEWLSGNIIPASRKPLWVLRTIFAAVPQRRDANGVLVLDRVLVELLDIEQELRDDDVAHESESRFSFRVRRGESAVMAMKCILDILVGLGATWDEDLRSQLAERMRKQ